MSAGPHGTQKGQSEPSTFSEVSSPFAPEYVPVRLFSDIIVGVTLNPSRKFIMWFTLKAWWLRDPVFVAVCGGRSDLDETENAFLKGCIGGMVFSS